MIVIVTCGHAQPTNAAHLVRSPHGKTLPRPSVAQSRETTSEPLKRGREVAYAPLMSVSTSADHSYAGVCRAIMMHRPSTVPGRTAAWYGPEPTRDWLNGQILSDPVIEPPSPCLPRSWRYAASTGHEFVVNFRIRFCFLPTCGRPRARFDDMIASQVLDYICRVFLISAEKCTVCGSVKHLLWTSLCLVLGLSSHILLD